MKKDGLVELLPQEDWWPLTYEELALSVRSPRFVVSDAQIEAIIEDKVGRDAAIKALLAGGATIEAAYAKVYPR